MNKSRWIAYCLALGTMAQAHAASGTVELRVTRFRGTRQAMERRRRCEWLYLFPYRQVNFHHGDTKNTKEHEEVQRPEQKELDC
jgi:hypothetical protein